MTIEERINGDSPHWKMVIRLSAIFMPIIMMFMAGMGTLAMSNIGEIKRQVILIGNEVSKNRDTLVKHLTDPSVHYNLKSRVDAIERGG